MSWFKDVAYVVTKSERYLVEQTDNGVQPEDPIQDVSQDPTVEYGEDE